MTSYALKLLTIHFILFGLLKYTYGGERIKQTERQIKRENETKEEEISFDRFRIYRQ